MKEPSAPSAPLRWILKPMAKSACNKCDPNELCEECPEWIFTLADLIMCMMGLFVILWVLKPEAAKKVPMEMNDELVEIVAKIREAFDYVPDPSSKDPVDQYMILQQFQRLKPPKGPGDGGNTTLERRGAVGDQPEVQYIRPGKQSTVGGRVLFERGSAELSNEAKRDLDQIIELIRGHKNIMLIKGHTSLDDLGDNDTAGDPQTRLDLSIRRAKAAADYLVSKGVEPQILRVLGCSTFEPVKQRAYTPEDKQLNRRVEVESTTTLVPELQDRPSAAANTNPATPTARNPA